MKWNRRVLEVAADAAVVLLGTMIYASGLYFFIEPCNMAPGGASGIALIISHLTGLPVGLLTAAINAPLFLLGYRYIGLVNEGGSFSEQQYTGRYHWLPWCSFVEVDPVSRLYDEFGTYEIPKE